jgi:peptidyl-tRNA hydrolase
MASRRFSLMIIGLGNNCLSRELYAGTRHNIGMDFIDYALQFHLNKSLQAQDLSNGQCQIYRYHNISLNMTEKSIGRRIIDLEPSIDSSNISLFFVKPISFMNVCGVNIRHALKSFSPDAFIVMHDCMDVNFGKFKFKEKGSANGHNGVKSIASILGTNFPRIRLGIGRPHESDKSVTKHVLSRFKHCEHAEIMNVIYPSLYKSLIN